MEKYNKIELIIDNNLARKKDTKFFADGTYHEDQKDLIEEKNLVNYLKEKVKRFGKLYYWISIIFATAYYNSRCIRKALSKYDLTKDVILNCGSGNKSFDKRVINVDLCNYPNVDVVADISRMPIKDNTVDMLINESILEHVTHPYDILNESYRVLKSGGRAAFVVPFMFPFHASPNDYNRWTDQGLKNIFSQAGFKDIKVKIIAGPASAFLAMLIELLANIFSFNIKFFYYAWFIFFSLFLWPIKFLDVWLNNYHTAKYSASILFIEARK